MQPGDRIMAVAVLRRAMRLIGTLMAAVAALFAAVTLWKWKEVDADLRVSIGGAAGLLFLAILVGVVGLFVRSHAVRPSEP